MGLGSLAAIFFSQHNSCMTFEISYSRSLATPITKAVEKESNSWPLLVLLVVAPAVLLDSVQQ